MSDIEHYLEYCEKLCATLRKFDWNQTKLLENELRTIWRAKRQVFLCGNGGSAGNSIHLANDFIYGVAKKTGGGMRIHSLAANSAVLTCLANDTGYDRIFAEQISVLSEPGDLLIVFSGSGNSPNIIEAVKTAKSLGVKTCGIIGFDGGIVREMLDLVLHVEVNDMQIAEDMQLLIGHMLMQRLCQSDQTN